MTRRNNTPDDAKWSHGKPWDGQRTPCPDPIMTPGWLKIAEDDRESQVRLAGAHLEGNTRRAPKKSEAQRLEERRAYDRERRDSKWRYCATCRRRVKDHYPSACPNRSEATG